MNERFKKVRKSLGLTQARMANDLHIATSTITAYETGNRSITDRTINDICTLYNVNEAWFRTGEGNMFKSMAQEEEIENFFRDVLLTEATSDGEKCRKALISALARIPTDKWEEIASVLNKLVEDYGDAKKEE